MFDSETLRRSFPGLDPEWAFFDNAGGTFPARQVVDAVREHLERYPVQLGATYPRSVEAAARVAAGRDAAARLFGARPTECVFGASTTVNVKQLARALRAGWDDGDAVVVTDADHEANIGPWVDLEARGIELRTWRVDPETLRLDPADLEPLLADGRVRLVAFTHASNILGTITDVPAVTALARARGALTCVDGVALAPHRRVDVHALGADFYLVSLYKVFGPHIGLLWGRPEALAGLASQNHFFVPSDRLPQAQEPGNPCYESVAAVPGILEHLEELATGPWTGPVDEAQGEDALDRAFERIARHEEGLVERLLAYLASRPDARVIGEPSADRSRRVAVVSFVLEGRSSKDVVEALESDGIAARFGHFYAYRLLERLDLHDVDGVIRVSLVHTNTLEEIERLVAALENL